MHPQVLAVVINCEGGSAAGLADSLAAAVHDAFAKTGQPIDLRLVKGDELKEAVAATSSPVVVVGGGDGTLASAASVLAGQGRCLAVLPLGTRNHFARDIGLDGTLEQAAFVAAHGQCDAVDVGYAGNRLFLNNASLGLYARMVEDRDRRRLPKWLATLPAALRVLTWPQTRRLDLAIDGERRRVKTPLLFIGNNRYSLDKGRIGQRPSLQGGELSVLAVAQRGGAAAGGFSHHARQGRSAGRFRRDRERARSYRLSPRIAPSGARRRSYRARFSADLPRRAPRPKSDAAGYRLIGSSRLASHLPQIRDCPIGAT